MKFYKNNFYRNEITWEGKEIHVLFEGRRLPIYSREIPTKEEMENWFNYIRYESLRINIKEIHFNSSKNVI